MSYYVGIDLHSDNNFIGIIDEKDKGSGSRVNIQLVSLLFSLKSNFFVSKSTV